MKKEQLFKAAGVITVASIISKVLGFFRETSLAGVFGATAATDAYLVATMIPWILFSVVSTALSTTLIPVFTQRVHDEGEEAGLRFINTLVNFVLTFCLILVIIGYYFAPQIVKIVARGFQGEVVDLTILLTRLLLPMMVFYALSAVYTGYLQSKERFTWPALVGIPFNVVMIASIFISGWTYGIVGVAIGSVLATASQILIMLPGLKRAKYRYQLVLDWKDPGFKLVGKLIIPILLGTGAGQLGTIVNRMLATGLTEGSISALNFGTRLTQLPLSIFIAAVATVLYPTFSNMAANGEMGGLRKALVGGIRASIFLTIPMAVGMIVLREPIVRVLFEHGAFDAEATAMTAYAVFFLGLGLLPMALREVISRVYFALKDTFTPMMLGIVAVVVNIILNFVLVGPLAHGGLALSTSIASLVAAVLLFIILRRKMGSLGGMEMWDCFWRVSLASAAMGCGVVALWEVLIGFYPDPGLVMDAVLLTVAICAGVAIYAVASVLLKLPEWKICLDYTKKIVRRFMGKGQSRGESL
ncbi:MAG: murein biosynthesis integral membrane protein MurJ [Syntrophaceticus sp.]|mgnify:CR=1 FL=1|jgi:putative peptidoglycan lipid II flippase|nr:murein biosynthesis integral membrane protein MurJ [Syntrophaceticus sp.]MDD3315115.1 murein biosynthesis integral membrane protein MurJ [Syntrophaceticus sp.]MDD4360476.1 murein biosynthesis integral membrane protein MurJ [Syntrophaceticus sp.]MDD4783592.1 murein biosynthesis integral membrane protein MurJ [Syntrophaceticus sp.]